MVSRWLDAHEDRSAQLWTLPHCLTFCDVAGTGEHRLVVAVIPPAAPSSGGFIDPRCRLRVYRGTSLNCELTLPDVPSGVISFYTDAHDSRVPTVAVSCGSSLLLFKNNKPYFRWLAPTMPVSALEIDVWRKLKAQADPETVKDGVEALKSLAHAEMSSRSQKLISLPPEQGAEFVGRYGNEDPQRSAVITCISTLSKNSLNKDSVSCVVVGTEAAHIYVLDPHGYSILHQVRDTFPVDQTSNPPTKN